MKCELSLKHSRFEEIFCENFLRGSLLFLFALLFLWPFSSAAQMFSVGDDRPRFNMPQRVAYIGMEPISVTYQGDPESPNRGLFAFEGSLIRLGYDTQTLDLSLGTGGEITGIDEVSYFDFSGKINSGFNLYRSRHIILRLPIIISSRYVNMLNSEQVQARFNQFRFGSLTVGGGGDLLVRPQDDIRISLGAVPSYGFAFPTGGTFGGALGSVSAHARLHFDRLFGDWGLSVGYQYDLRNYDVEEDVYDYKMNGHVLELGVTF